MKSVCVWGGGVWKKTFLWWTWSILYSPTSLKTQTHNSKVKNAGQVDPIYLNFIFLSVVGSEKNVNMKNGPLDQITNFLYHQIVIIFYPSI